MGNHNGASHRRPISTLSKWLQFLGLSEKWADCVDSVAFVGLIWLAASAFLPDGLYWPTREGLRFGGLITLALVMWWLTLSKDWTPSTATLVGKVRRLCGVLAVIAAFGLIVLLLPKTPGVTPMSGGFNILVAEFGRANSKGAVESWEGSSQLSQSLLQQLRDELTDISVDLPRIEVRHESVGLVKGASIEQRTQDTRSLAKQHGADLVLYGNIADGPSGVSFTPEFYLDELQREADELVGHDKLGSPITLGPSQLGNRSLIRGELAVRTRVLVLFTVGLAYLKLENYSKALEYFDRADQIGGWKETEGKEVLYLFVGTAYRQREGPGDAASARQAYERAIHLNPSYARPHLGLGNVYYEGYRRDLSDETALDQALAHYEEARNIEPSDSSIYEKAKVHLTLGNGYLVKAQAGHPEFFSQAEREYKYVVQIGEESEKEFEALVAGSLLGLGIVKERRDQDCIAAARYYRKSIAKAGRFENVKGLAQNQLKIVESRSDCLPARSQ